MAMLNDPIRALDFATAAACTHAVGSAARLSATVPEQARIGASPAVGSLILALLGGCIQGRCDCKKCADPRSRDPSRCPTGTYFTGQCDTSVGPRGTTVYGSCRCSTRKSQDACKGFDDRPISDDEELSPT